MLASMQDSRMVNKLATCPQSSTGRAGPSAPPLAILFDGRCNLAHSMKVLVSTHVASLVPLFYWCCQALALRKQYADSFCLKIFLFHPCFVPESEILSTSNKANIRNTL